MGEFLARFRKPKVEEPAPVVAIPPGEAKASMVDPTQNVGASAETTIWQDLELVGDPILRKTVVKSGVVQYNMGVSATGEGTDDLSWVSAGATAQNNGWVGKASASVGTYPARKPQEPVEKPKKKLFGRR